MRKITVEAEQLESCAARMEEKSQDYNSHCNELFSAVDAMHSAWQGADNTAFTNRISSYESDFRSLHLLANEYCEFLRNSARAYRDTQDELTSLANSLGN